MSANPSGLPHLPNHHLMVTETVFGRHKVECSCGRSWLTPSKRIGNIRALEHYIVHADDPDAKQQARDELRRRQR